MGKHGVRPDPEKIKTINDLPAPTNIKGLRKLLSLAAYLHKYFAQLRRDNCSSIFLLKKNEKWLWSAYCQRSFEGIRKSLTRSKIRQLRTKTVHFMRSVGPWQETPCPQVRVGKVQGLPVSWEPLHCLYGTCVFTHGCKQSTSLSTNSKVVFILRGV